MARYIDAEELLQKKSIIRITGHFDLPHGGAQNYSAILDTEIMHFPTADVAPIIHGSWSTVQYTKEDIFDYSFKCSNCDKETPRKAYVIAPDYCPNCGSTMDGREE